MSEREDSGAPVADRRLLKRIWPFVKPHWRLMAGSLVLLPMVSALTLLPPYLLKRAIDESIVVHALDKLPTFALMIVGAMLAQHLLGFAQMLLLAVCGQRAMHDLRRATHRHLIGLRVGFFDRTPIGRLMTRVTNDVESIAEAFASGLIALVGDVFTLLGIVIAMLWLDMRLALISFCILPLLLVVVIGFQRVLRAAYRLIRRRLARINATLQEQMTGVKVVQIFGGERRAALSFDEVNRDYRDGYRASIKYDAALFALVEMLGSVTVAGLLWWGGHDVVGGTVTFGLLVAFIEYVQKFFIPIRDMSTKYATMQQAMAASERVFELLDTDEPDAASRSDNAAGASLPDGPLRVRFDDVRFSYDGQRVVLDDMSFTVEPGENVAVVGATGAGKSTLVRLLTRLYEIDSGRLEVGGHDIRDIDIAELRRRVVVLSQDVFLFTGTVRDNITLGDSEIDEARARDAAERVGLLQLLSLDHEVLERGANLSAGERQLVVFARALARDPALLILDEATSSVDPTSEQIIQEGIEELMRQRTAIIIAHRLSTIEKVHRVLALADGHVVEEGPHDELLAKNGLYARLHRLQYIGSLSDA